MFLTYWLSSISALRRITKRRFGRRRSSRRVTQHRDVLTAMQQQSDALQDRTLLAGIWDEGFETDGNGSRYTTSKEFFLGSGTTADYYTRVEDTNGDATGQGTGLPDIDLDSESVDEYTGFAGQWYFAAEKVDERARPKYRVIDFDPIVTSAFENLAFTGDFGAGDTDSSPAYGSDHILAVLYSIEGGTNYIPAIVFRHDGNDAGALDATNQPLAAVTNIQPSGNNGFTTLAQLGAQLSTGVITTNPGSTTNIDDYIAIDSSGTNFAAAGAPLTEDRHLHVVDWGDGSAPEEISAGLIAPAFAATHTNADGGIFTIIGNVLEDHGKDKLSGNQGSDQFVPDNNDRVKQ